MKITACSVDKNTRSRKEPVKTEFGRVQSRMRIRSGYVTQNYFTKQSSEVVGFTYIPLGDNIIAY